jgi:hypothetical protein
MGLGFDGPSLAMVSQQPSDEGEADAEPTRALAQRAFSSLHGVDDALAEILRRGGHGAPPPKRSPSNRAPSNR